MYIGVDLGTTNSVVSTIDLSSFNTVNLKHIGRIFQGCAATTGYAKTAEDAIRLNSSVDKPTSLVFIVK